MKIEQKNVDVVEIDDSMLELIKKFSIVSSEAFNGRP